MSTLDRFQQVSQSPTRPPAEDADRTFDVADLYRGPLATGATTASSLPLDEKLRQAYFWLVNHAIVSPFYDVEFNDGPPQSFKMGDQAVDVRLPSDQSYSSYVLLPLLNLA